MASKEFEKKLCKGIVNVLEDMNKHLLDIKELLQQQNNPGNQD